MAVRYFTPAEAIATLPRLRPLLAALREAWHENAFARAQVEEIRRMHGADAAAREDALGAEARAWGAKEEETRRHLEQLAQEVRALGAELKDPLLGLVDFYARRGEETVFLCYRDDEATITHWHPLTTGFAGRRPLSDL